ncbi:MAG: putative GNAT family acetyltransferase [Psychrobacter glaciei]|jgi:predicted GNAT family acetyltransferase|uniref:N-acetyltransferase n=1 Tax=Psychrobacter glaciei TaxID=619771 RepID=A0ABQ3GSL2_9GAMM|nr:MULTISPECIES: GNAT family N-acetyltransferase [Psychrobacter]MBF4490054.1 N-acetyltransferase [Psychrobacter sp. N25K4-3-2]GHD31115.1 N-acetyltransferase [Psychrobacter glaciei]|tara:strand:- start:671 stop:964 length:294 start_codon:yes stop_codon:yes gene_type:complete
MNDNIDKKHLDIVHDEQAKRFETSINGHTGYISYQERDGKLVYDHTIVPQELGGRGVGSGLVKHALDYAREQDKKVVPQCSFVASYISKHPEYQDLV